MGKGYEQISDTERVSSELGRYDRGFSLSLLSIVYNPASEFEVEVEVSALGKAVALLLHSVAGMCVCERVVFWWLIYLPTVVYLAYLSILSIYLNHSRCLG